MLRRLLGSLRGARPQPAARPGGAADAATLNEAGIAAWRRGDLAAAEQALRAALRADPAWPPAYGNLGMVLWERRALDEGLACLQRAVALDPEHVGQRVNLANALAFGNRMPEAIAEYREVLRRQPGHVRACANLAKPLLDVCDWDGAEAFASDLVARWRAGDAEATAAITPFASLLYDLPPEFRLAVARRQADAVSGRVAGLRRPERSASGHARLRLGYLSADFHDHATAHLAAGLFEHHDRDRFEVHAYSFGPDDASAYRRRVVAAFEHFDDVRDASAEAVATRIAADGIDVLVDLKGYTAGSRPEILALRPAPVQVSWLGYPGTMGAGFMDYLVADAHVVPASHAAHYAERIVRLPGSYQANDDRQAIDPEVPSREACGLPAHGVVFACFNSHAKIERSVFAAWMRVLAAVPGSVLWLLGGHGVEALRRAAHAHGIDPARLVFAPKLGKPAHLARHACADLFLDTRTCNAHTTASDALWAGLPVLTCPGGAFAGRVAASLLGALGLSDVVAADLADYERRAIGLGRDPAALAALRGRLAEARGREPLFATARFTAHFEAAVLGMHERARSGADPAAFDLTL